MTGNRAFNCSSDGKGMPVKAKTLLIIRIKTVGIAKIANSMMRLRSTPYLKIRGSRIRIMRIIIPVLPIIEATRSPSIKLPLKRLSREVKINEKTPPKIIKEI